MQLPDDGVKGPGLGRSGCTCLKTQPAIMASKTSVVAPSPQPDWGMEEGWTGTEADLFRVIHRASRDQSKTQILSFSSIARRSIEAYYGIVQLDFIFGPVETG